MVYPYSILDINKYMKCQKKRKKKKKKSNPPELKRSFLRRQKREKNWLDAFYCSRPCYLTESYMEISVKLVLSGYTAHITEYPKHQTIQLKN